MMIHELSSQVITSKKEDEGYVNSTEVEFQILPRLLRLLQSN